MTENSMPLNMVGGGVGSSNPLQFDIASSADEEVKISLTCKSSGNSYFRKRNLGVVMGEVEDECRSRYGIQDPDFSLVGLMEKVCKKFLEIDNGSRKEQVLKIPDTSKKSDKRDPALQQRRQSNGVVYPDNIIESVNKASAKKIKLLKDQRSSSSQISVTNAVIQKKYPVYLKDIARGEENVQIPLMNGCSDMELPNFLYIRNNMIHKNAHIDFSIARVSNDNCCAQCYGDCLSSALPCACAGETRGEFAYVQGGLLREEFLDECIAMSREPERKHCYYCEVCPLQNDLLQKGRKIKPCKGHLTRKFIKECWSNCGCSKKCGNRVVQRGIQVPLQVFSTPGGKGWGLRCVRALKKGTFVCEYVGEIVTNMELDERNKERAAKQERHTYPVLLDADWGSERMLKDEEALCLDATEFGNTGRFINHRCYDASLIEIPVEVETPDHHYYHLAFFTTRDIAPMEELTWDYGIEFDDINHPIKAFKCKCGSAHCRDKKRKLIN